ncbi:MAG: TIGR01212 family radical SAM protein [Candidatus Omnitrophica bacterium]|nr:TIGR01212 family radical SAM protein [Candidatus Omnitrophota bacterium]
MKLYNDYGSYLKNKYGCKVYRIGLDGGFSCPNRDGTKGYEGCLYCSDDGSRSAYTKPSDDIKTQLASRIGFLKDTRSADKFIAYFQAFTSTYAPVDKLKGMYDQIKGFDEIVGLSIGTRPDTIDADKFKLISSYTDKYEVWLELGLQSIHDKTLARINRGHSFGDFLSALKLAGKFGIPVCAHVILGLPGETKEDMMGTARMLTELKVGAVKIHLLHILKGSPLEKMYEDGEVPVMSQAQYAELVCDFLEELSPGIIVQRLTGEGNSSNHIAPAWALNKIETINLIRDTLKKRGTFQGSRCGPIS